MKLKKRLIVAVCLIIIMVLSGCTKDQGPSLKEGLFSNEDVKRILEEEGLDLTKVSEQPSMKVDTNITPTSYEVGENEDTLFIYSFDSISSCKEFLSIFHSTYNIENENLLLHIYAAKNIAIVYEPPQEFSAATAAVSQNISNAVFYRMNDVKKVAFQGGGDYWNTNLDLEYFEYEWEDDKGEERLEYYGRYELSMTFLDENSEEVSDLVYQFSINENRSIGERISSQEGESVLEKGATYSRSSTIDRPIENEALDFMIEWNNYEENFTLIKSNKVF
ncbi:hypothetical protein EDC19_1827 [Natranaerovirga hydrolytica]|uniref:Lipoprotein n=1 Tax=Natranaerovirga hydrolytica TaxID=680378 RepID=A0A4R1MRY1_9FIRM|nr:hypothetical protein [Natranaerovirga hydrolytica]TCK92673.1 hypothetical protein EDC19_1827 [Natranaerovirga hydrolytica]